jgi:hypothetical protein
MDGASRHANQIRLRELKQQHCGEVTLFCAHDPVELAQLSQRGNTLGGTGKRHAA